MAKLEVKFTAVVNKEVLGDFDNIIAVKGTVEVRTPSGQVYVSHDKTAGMTLVVVRGEKGSTVVKFNDKAVV